MPLLGVIVGLIKCKTKEAEWSIYKLSTGLQLVSRLVILLGSLSALVGGIQCCVLIITLPPPYLHIGTDDNHITQLFLIHCSKLYHCSIYILLYMVIFDGLVFY